MPNKYLERLKQLNNKPEGWTVWDSIDRPIRELVYHMNRIGLKTIFSCCGFPYPGEEEPKSHAQDAYVLFYVYDLSWTVEKLSVFGELVKKYNWYLGYQGGNQWNIRHNSLTKDSARGYWDKDGSDLAIHDYEQVVLSLTNLTKVLRKWETVDMNVVIRDGNDPYQSEWDIPEWQVKPKKEVILKDIII